MPLRFEIADYSFVEEKESQIIRTMQKMVGSFTSTTEKTFPRTTTLQAEHLPWFRTL